MLYTDTSSCLSRCGCVRLITSIAKYIASGGCAAGSLKSKSPKFHIHFPYQERDVANVSYTICACEPIVSLCSIAHPAGRAENWNHGFTKRQFSLGSLGKGHLENSEINMRFWMNIRNLKSWYLGLCYIYFDYTWTICLSQVPKLYGHTTLNCWRATLNVKLYFL